MSGAKAKDTITSAGFGPGGARGGQGAMHRPGPPGLIGTGDKAKNFKNSFKRLLGRFRPERGLMVFVLVLAVFAVSAQVAAPQILKRATNDIFAGAFSGGMDKAIGKLVAANPQIVERYPSFKDVDPDPNKVIILWTKQDVTKFLADSQTGGATGTKTADLVKMAEAMDLRPAVGIDFGAVGRILVFVLAIYILSTLFSWLQGFLMAGVIVRTVLRLRRDVDEKVARLPLKFFDSHARGDILSRLTNDIDNIQQTMQQVLTQLITSVLTLVGVLAMMFWISWELALISLVVLPVSSGLAMVVAKRSQKQFTLQWERTGNLNGHVEEMFTGHNIVKIFGHQREAVELFDKHNDGLYQASFKAQFISGIIMPVMIFVSNLNYVAVCVLGGLRVAHGTMTLGDVQAFIQYVQQFGQPIAQTASAANVLQSAVASGERVFETLDESEQSAEPEHPVVLKDIEGRIAMNQVSFRYAPDTPLIDGLDLDVQPGQTVAIVGPTGAGKTTLVNLLMRFYEIQDGEISVDGVNTKLMRRDDLRRLFGMVLQDAWLFSGTIRENIAYGREGATEADIRAAAEAAHVDHFVRALPDGYNTMIEDESTNLSQGERQLITIARAFLADPQILILDEATSSVDTRTEVLIQKAMARLLKGRTSFVIAHRLSTIRDADLILVMNQGAIVEQGTHHDLLCQKGFYWDLYNSQFAEALHEAC